jgi:hypothetical protein
MSAHKCEGVLFGRYGNNQCAKNAAYEHEGKWFCKTHHPPTREAKSEARTADWQAKWNAQAEASNAKSAAQAEQKRRADCYPDLLAELQNISNADPSKWDKETRDQFQQWAQSRARAAIEQARGQS